jgi:dipeptidyl aminopeptidase/acylaminoacyl peptidase
MKYVTFALCLILVLAWSDNSDARKLELTDYLNYETVADPQLSPDGDRIVYVRRRVNKFTDTTDNEIWQMDSDGRRNRFLLKGGHVRWSPDGTRIAYIGAAEGKAQLFVRWMDAEGAVTQITHDQMSPGDFAWSPDGRSIAFRAQVPMKPGFSITLPPRPPGAKWTEDPPVFERLHYRMDRAGLKTGFDHLFVVPSEGGTPRQLTSGEWDVGRRFSGLLFDGPFHWSPDGRTLLFSAETDPAAEVKSANSAIRSVDVASAAMTTLFGEPGSWALPTPSPNGKYIAYIGSEPSPSPWPATQIRLMNSNGTDSRVLVDGLTSPLFPLRWSDNSQGLYLVLGREGASQIYLATLDGQLTRVTDGNHRLDFASISGNTALGVISQPHVTPNVARVNLRNGGVEQITDVNSDIFADVEFGEVEEIWYDSSDDTRVQGWVVTPPDFDPEKEYPLLLEIHGGPQGMYDVGFNFRFQEFASQGYVVVYTNPRGSTGYGMAFTSAIDNAYPGRVDFDDLMAGVDSVIGRGYIDEERLYVAGCSGGGALTSWVVGHTTRFAAAAALCPVINWISMAGTADVAAWANKQFVTPFWEDPTLWLEHSPLMHVGKVTTPTLLITGDKDLRTPLSQAEEFYAALKNNGVDTALIPMRNEYHVTWIIPSNMLRTQLYLRKWFEKHGGGALTDDEGSDIEN